MKKTVTLTGKNKGEEITALSLSGIGITVEVGCPNANAESLEVSKLYDLELIEDANGTSEINYSELFVGKERCNLKGEFFGQIERTLTEEDEPFFAEGKKVIFSLTQKR